MSARSLDRLLQSQGFGTRRACRALIATEQVHIDGTPCTDPDAVFDLTGRVIQLAGENWPFQAAAYVLLHKPAGYECSQKPLHHPSVYSLLAAPLRHRGVQAIGRLDQDTTGLLLFSDDGQFGHRLTAPKWKVPKVYRVTTKHPVSAALVAALLDGVQLHDEPVPIAALDCAPETAYTLRLTLAEGKYHQVKRMIAAAGNRVEALCRIAIGTLELPPDLAPGEWRWLSTAAVNALQPAR